MKKTIVAIFCLGAVGSAFAQASSVTLYGTVDGGISSVQGATAGGTTTAATSGQQSYSRIGFRGAEDLGNNLVAQFVLEQGIFLNDGTLGLSDGYYNADTAGNHGVFNSQAYVGLGGTWGTVRFGRQFTPLYQAYAAVDPFKNGFAADINRFFGTDINNFSNYQRISNAVMYESPLALQGLRISAAYGFGGQAGSVTTNSQLGIGLTYASGPLTVAYAFHQANDANETTIPENPYATFRTNFIGVAYDMGNVKLHGAIDENEQGTALKTRDYLVGLTLPLGDNALFADYTRKNDKLHTDSDATQYAIGYTHALSKRTNLYAAYTYVTNQRVSFVGTNVAGNSVSTIQAGLRHMF